MGMCFTPGGTAITPAWLTGVVTQGGFSADRVAYHELFLGVTRVEKASCSCYIRAVLRNDSLSSQMHDCLACAIDWSRKGFPRGSVSFVVGAPISIGYCEELRGLMRGVSNG